MERFSRYADYVPTALIVAGFVLIGLGWNGAASLDFVHGQVPYLISGGLIGLALVFFGAAAFVVQTFKKGQAVQEQHLRELTQTMKRVATSLSLGENGPAASDNSEYVVAGASSFHLPECRIVGTRPGLARVPRGEAVEEGLEPCRICNP